MENIRSYLCYSPDSGEFTWLKGGFGRAKEGAIAGRIMVDGYVQIYFNRKPYLAHRLAFWFMNGDFPARDVDHVDGIRDNNSWGNLRECNASENHQNRKTPITNTSGAIGVFACGERWRARIRFYGKRKCLGTFDSVEEASQAYLDAKKQLHKFNPVPRSEK